MNQESISAMDDRSDSRREFLRNALSVLVVASSAPLRLLGGLVPAVRFDDNGTITVAYVLRLVEYPALADVYGSVKLSTLEQLKMNPDHVVHAISGDFPIVVTRVAMTGFDAFKAVSSYCTHNRNHAVDEFDPVTREFVCQHRGSSFSADGTHIPKPGTPTGIGNLRSFHTVFDETADTVTIEGVLEAVAATEASQQTGNIPEATFLDQNHPNPFSHAALFRYGLPKRSHARLTVSALDGTLVATVIDAVQPTGIYTTAYTPTALAAGTYYARLETESGPLVRRITLAP